MNKWGNINTAHNQPERTQGFSMWVRDNYPRLYEKWLSWLCESIHHVDSDPQCFIFMADEHSQVCDEFLFK